MYPNYVDNGLMSTQKKTEGLLHLKKQNYGRESTTAIICLKQSYKRVDVYDFAVTVQIQK